jgi:hypothetical protein
MRQRRAQPGAIGWFRARIQATRGRVVELEADLRPLPDIITLLYGTALKSNSVRSALGGGIVIGRWSG